MLTTPVPHTPTGTRTRTRTGRTLGATVVAVVATLGLLPAAAGTATAAPGDPIMPDITITSASPPALNTPFMLDFRVRANGMPAPNAPIQITWGGGAPIDTMLGGGSTSFLAFASDPGHYTATITYTGMDAVAGAVAGWSYDFWTDRRPQTITLSGLPRSADVGEALDFETSTTSRLPVIMAVSGPCSSTGMTVYTTGPGICQVTAGQTGDDLYAPVAVTWKIGVSADSVQMVLFDGTVPPSLPFQSAPITLAARASSGLPVTFALVTGPCSIAGDQLTMLSSGDCVVEAEQAGAPGWLPATAQQTILVTPATSTLTITTDPDPVVPGEPFDITFAVNAGDAEVPDDVITYAIGKEAPAQVALVNGVAHVSTTLPAPWHGSVTATYDGAPGILAAGEVLSLDLRQTQTVGLAAALAGPVASGAAVGDGPFPLPTTTSLGLPVSYLTVSGPCAVSGGELRLTGVGTCHVEGSNAGTADVDAVLEGVDIAVAPAAQTITLTGAPGTFTGAGRFTVHATSSIGAHVTIGASGACTASGEDAADVAVVGVGECVITASAAGDAVTAPGTATARVAVTAAPADLDVTLGGRVGDLVSGASVHATGSGLRPGTALTVTVYSDPVLLGSAVAGSTGAGEVVGTLPTLVAGTHRLVLAGTALDGSAVRTELSFGVATDGTITWVRQAAPRGMATTGADVGGLGALAVLTVLAGASLLIVRRRLVQASSELRAPEGDSR